MILSVALRAKCLEILELPYMHFPESPVNKQSLGLYLPGWLGYEVHLYVYGAHSCDEVLSFKGITGKQKSDHAG